MIEETEDLLFIVATTTIFKIGRILDVNHLSILVKNHKNRITETVATAKTL